MANYQKQDTQFENQELVTVINKKGFLVSMTMKEAERQGLIAKTTMK